MGGETANKKRYKKVLFVGIGFGMLFWIFEAALHAFVFRDAAFINGLFSPQVHEIWMRSFGVILVVIFGGYAQLMIVRHQEAQKETEFAYTELNQIFNTAADAMRVIDRNFIVRRVNDTFAALAGIDKKDAIGKKCFEIFRGSMCHYPECPLTRILKKEERIECEVEKERQDGRKIPCLLTATPFLSATGQLIGIVEDFKDITERNKTNRKLERVNIQLLKSNKKLKDMALRDFLTGLYNYRYLERVLEAEFSRARRYDYPLSIIMMDIDYFKSINDAYGHPFGDLVLKQLAGCISETVRKYDIVIRFGGDEFIVISPSLEREKVLLLARRILNKVEVYPFGDEDTVVNLRLSIAVASHPEDNVNKSMDLIECADKLLSKAKQEGGDNIYSSEDTNVERFFPAKKSERHTDIIHLKSKIDKLTKRANQSVVESIFAFAKTIELKDHYTGEHVEKTVYYATETARTLNLSRDEIENVKKASRLHDLGKVGISESILLKPAKLTEEEFEEIKKHPQIGVDIIRLIQSLRDIVPLILHHQERWDGKGYPAGLKGDDIPLGARIIAVADVYQALISDRPYRKAYPQDVAIEMIREGCGIQFDPQVVNVFLEVLGKRMVNR